MDTDLIGKLGTIAGIGGISLGVLFFLFREVIRKNIFPKLTKDQAYKIINRVILYTFLVALAGIISWTITEVLERMKEKPSATEQLEVLRSQQAIKDSNPESANAALSSGGVKLVDVRFQKLKPKHIYPVLDIKLRNTGSIAFLKSAVFRVNKVLTIEGGNCAVSAEEPNRNYDINLTSEGSPYSIEYPISQSIKPQDVDRFTFTLGVDEDPSHSRNRNKGIGRGGRKITQPTPSSIDDTECDCESGKHNILSDHSGHDHTAIYHDYIFFLTVDIVYDEDNKRLTLPQIAFTTVDENYFHPFACGDTREVYFCNRSVISKLLSFDGVINESLRSQRDDVSRSLVPVVLKNLKETIEFNDYYKQSDLNNRHKKWYIEFLAMLKEIDPNAKEALKILAANSDDEVIRKLATEYKDKVIPIPSNR